MTKESKLFYFIIIPSLIIPTIMTFLYFRVFSQNIIGKLIYGAEKISMILIPLLLIRSKQFSLKSLLAGNKKQSILLGTASGILIGIIVFVLYFFNQKTMQQYGVNVYNKLVEFKIVTWFILFSLFLSLFNSLFEEFYWRWFLLSGLKIKIHPLPAMFIGSTAFALHHLIIMGEYVSGPIVAFSGFAVFIGGMVWCWIYQKTGSVIGSWISHLIIDAVILTIAYLMIRQYY